MPPWRVGVLVRAFGRVGTDSSLHPRERTPGRGGLMSVTGSCWRGTEAVSLCPGQIRRVSDDGLKKKNPRRRCVYGDACNPGGERAARNGPQSPVVYGSPFYFPCLPARLPTIAPRLCSNGGRRPPPMALAKPTPSDAPCSEVCPGHRIWDRHRKKVISVTSPADTPANRCGTWLCGKQCRGNFLVTR